MRIVICEDEPTCVDMLNTHIKQWAGETGVLVELSVCVSAEQLLSELEDGLRVDLIFLDIRMPKMSGIELAHILREHSYRMQIVFATDSPENVFEGYNVSALNYLVKPIDYETCRRVLERAHELTDGENYYLCKTSDSLHRIPYEDILYIEMLSHTAVIHSRNAQYSTRKTIAEITAELDDKLFIRCHKSFVINIQHVVSISKKEIVMSDKASLGLGKAFASDINDRFIKYYKFKR